MKYRKTFIAIGFLTAVIPFIGFPLPWKTVLYVIIGLIIMLVSYMSGGHTTSQHHGEQHGESETI